MSQNLKNETSIQHRCKTEARKMLPKSTKMLPKLIQHRSTIDAQIDSKTDATLAIQKSIKNRVLERQRIAKVTSAIRWRENRTLRPQDHPERIPTRRWAEGLAN